MSIMRNVSADTQKVTHCSADCGYLEDFKAFLRNAARDAATTEAARNDIGKPDDGMAPSIGCGAEMRSFILTRNNNDTYPICGEELEAEVLMSVWHQLGIRHFPDHFRVGITKLVVHEVTSELENAKLQEDLAVSKTANNEEVVEKCKQLDLLKVQRFIAQHIDKLFLRLSDNSKADNLKNYADCVRLPSGKDQTESSLHHAVAAIKNKLRKMEDRHMCLPRFSDLFDHEEQYSYFAVFDGHSGSLAATYAANQLGFMLSKQLKSTLKSNLQDEHDYYREVLEASFVKTDLNFSQKRLGSGTTAVCALIKANSTGLDHLYVAWVGDSRCLLVSPTVALQIVKAHKPDSLDERKRIESAETGGAVILAHGQWRVNGIINVSRSIGDFSVKAVIAEPDFVDLPFQPSHDFLLLGSDGLWDHVSEADIVKCVYKALMDEEQAIDDIPKHLIELAKQGDSQDNITAVLVLLKNRSQIIENYAKSMAKSE